MINRLLFNYHLQKLQKEEEKRFKLFLLLQCMQYAAPMLLFIGGICIVIFACKLIFK